MGLSSQQSLQQTATLAAGLQQLESSGQLGDIIFGGNGGNQKLSWNGTTAVLTLSNGNSVHLGALAQVNPAISKTGNTLSVSGSDSTVDLGSYLDNTDAQKLARTGTTLTISGGNSIDLAPINTDNQTVSLSGSNLTISGGNTVDLSSINTDALAALNCAAGQIVQWNGVSWVCASPSAGSDSQTLTLSGNNLSILNANSVNLSAYLDNTDSQALSLSGNTLSLVSGGSVNLGAYLDNTDVLASLGCATNQLAKWNGTTWTCANDTDTQLSEAQVDAYTGNNGYLTSEVDGSTTNEIQGLTWNSGTHILTISSGNTADLGSLLDNTDAQSISKTGNTLSISGNASTVDLASYMDNTDAQSLSRSGTTLTISGGNSIDLAPINTDSQNLSLSGTTLNISGGTGVNIASINTDVLASLSCTTNQIAKWNGTAWACAADVDTDTILSEAQVDTYAGNNGYLTSEVDGSVTNEIQSLSLAANVLSISGNAGTINLSSYLDNTDAQSLSYNTGTHVLSISGNAGTIDLSNLIDNTDTLASLGCTTNQIAKWNGTAWACASDSDAQSISKTGNTLSISGNASTVDLSSYIDNTDLLASMSCTAGQIVQWNGTAWVCITPSSGTDSQNLSLNTNTLSISNGNSVSLAAYLDNTDAQAISLASNTLSISGNAGTVNLSAYLDNTDSQALSLGGNTLSLVDGGSVNLAAYLDNTDVLASLGCTTNQIAKWNGTAWACSADIDTQLSEAQVDSYANNNGYLTSEVDGSTSNELQTLSWNSGTHILTISNGNTADLGSLLDNTDTQAISKTGNTLSISGNASTVDLASYLDNTDSQTLSLAGSTLTVSGGNSIDLAPINTDAQDLSLSGTTLNISGGTGVNIASINTDVLAGLSCTTNQIAKWNGTAWACSADVDTDIDAQTLSLASNSLSILGGNSVSLAGYLDNTDAQTLSYNTGTHVLSIFGGNTADLSNLLDNTDAQSISKTDNTLSISGNASTVDLSGYLDNTDVLASLSCSTGQIAKWGGSAWACAADVDTDTVLSEAQVDAYAGNNGYLTNEVDGSTTNEIQDLSLSGDTLSLSSDGTTVDLSDYMDDTDSLAALSCIDGKIVKRTSGSWACGDDNNTTYSAGTGIAIDGSNVISSSLGTSVDSAEIVDGTIATADVADGAITNVKLATSSLTVTAGTGLTGGGTVSLGGTVTLNLASDFGSSIDSSEITDGTVATADLATGAVTSNTIADGTIATIDLAGGSVTAAKLANCSSDGQILKYTTASGWACAADTDTDTTYSAGTGIAIDGSNVISSSLGSSVDSSEITDGTIATADIANASITFAKLGQNSCGDGQVIKWSTASTAWICAADVDTDTVLSEAQVDAYVGNNGYLTTEVDGSTANEIQDLSLSGNTLALSSDGTTVDLSAYMDDTDTLAALSCSPGQVAQWSGTAWVCATPAVDTDTQDLSLVGDTLSLVNGGSVDLSAYMDDTVLSEAQVDAYANNNGYLTSEVDGSTTNELQNIFQTVATPDANNPSADSTTDTLTFANGSGVTITSNGTTDTITIATTLGTDITSSEIVDGAVANADLANSSLTVSAGTGLSGGGTVSLGGTVTLSLANDFGSSIDSSEITNGTLVFADLGQNGCNDGDVIKWSSGSTAWTCGTDNSGGSVNSFATVATPAGTSPVADSSTDTLNFSGTGITITGNSTTDTIAFALTNDFGASIDSSEITDGTIVGADVSDGSIANADLTNSSLSVSAGNGLTNGGSVSLGGSTTLNIGAGNGITVNADDIAVKTLTATDALSSITSSGSGMEVLASGVGLLQGCADAQVLKWDETNDVWACANDTDTQPSEATIESYIFDADNTGTLSSGTLALGSLSYTGVLTDANVSDTLTIGATSTVSDSALSSNVSKLGAAIESSEITDGTIAAADIAPDSLDFTELKDAMTLDATTAIALGANDFNINLDSTGTFNVQDGGTNVLSVLADGTFRFQNSADSTTSFVVNDAASLPMLTVDTVANAVEIGTLVDDAADVLLVLDGVSGADPTGVAGGMYYNTTNSKFRCYQGAAWVDCISPVTRTAYVSSDVSTVPTHTNYVDVTGASFTNLAANTKYHYKFVISHTSGAITTGIGFGVTTPAGPTAFRLCTTTMGTRSSVTAGYFASYCSGVAEPGLFTTGVQATATEYQSTVDGYIETGATGGTLQLRMRAEVNAAVTAKAGTYGELTRVE